MAQTYLGIDDTEYVRYSFDTFKGIIHHFEETAITKGIKVSGIRFRFAAYPKNTEKYGDNAGHASVVIEPTYMSANGNQNDVTLKSAEDPEMANNGTPCPPYCDEPDTN